MFTNLLRVWDTFMGYPELVALTVICITNILIFAMVLIMFIRYNKMRTSAITWALTANKVHKMSVKRAGRIKRK